MNTPNQQYLEIDMLKLLGSLFKRWYIIIASAIIGAGAALAISIFCISPTYEASVLMYVNNSVFSVGSQAISISGGDISTSRTLVDTYCTILKTRLTLEEVIEETGVSYSYEKLCDMITASSVNGTEIFSVTVTSNNPVEACTIANTIAKVLPEKISAVVEGCSVRTVDLAVVPTTRSSPSYARLTAIGLLCGIVIACILLAVIELFNDTVDEDAWLTSYFGESIPILSIVPDADSRAASDRRYYYYGKSNTNGSGPSGKPGKESKIDAKAE